MKIIHTMRWLALCRLACCCLAMGPAGAQTLDQYRYQGNISRLTGTVRSETKFNGYTDHWHDEYKEWYRYGNLFKMSVEDPEKTIAQSKIDVAEDMGLPGLGVQEGFMKGLLSAGYTVLERPGTIGEIEQAAVRGNILVTADPGSAVGRQLSAGVVAEEGWGDRLKSHQYGSIGLRRSFAYSLVNKERTIFVLLSADSAALREMLALIADTKTLLATYDLKKGWFGAETLLKSVTCMQGHPLELIGKGMNEGNSWIVFSGYMEFLEQAELKEWMAKVNLPFVTDVGFLPIYGCADYEGLQVQDMQGKQSWIDFAKKKKGYVFRPVYDTASDPYQYDGYIAQEGNKEQADNDEVPFVTPTGGMPEDLLTSMMLFVKKGETLTKAQIWDAILHRREVAILGKGKMMGPAAYRRVMEWLWLDRAWLEEYFGDRVSVEANVNEYTLDIKVTNTYDHAVSGKLDLQLPPEIRLKGGWDAAVSVPAGESRTIHVKLLPGAAGMNRTNPIAVYMNWDEHRKGTLAMLDLPPAISVHRLLYAMAPKVSYPVTIHNFSEQTSFPVKVELLRKNRPTEVVFTVTKICTAATAHYQDLAFDLSAAPGDYVVKVSALGLEYRSQLGVGKAEGRSFAYELDLNSDGVKEYRLENDSVQVTLLATGARVIEYIVKSRQDNVLFKLWPEKASDDRRSFRKREYYPYGGFEDFLGQGSMETHRIYHAELVKKEGNYVQVKMTTDYFGNRLEKTFTLYGNSPLLEIRFALQFVNPEANVLGPQPILELGKSHGTEDVFMIPSKEGLQEMRMRPEYYWGRIFHLQEGWNAGYDTKEDITYVGAYPVDQPLFLHMWMNHPRNPGAHYYYTEFQPWTPIFQKSTMYFSYYMWGAGGPWQNGVKALRDRNLITEIK